MAELMQKVKTPFVALKKGETVRGRITKLTSSEIIVDLGAKAEAIVLEKDKSILRNLLAALKVGDEVMVNVLSPEGETGNPVVSLRRFMGDRLWDRLLENQKAQEPIDVIVKEFTKGGFLVETAQGISGFLPNSQTAFIDNSQAFIDKTIQVYILEAQRKEHKIIFSQRPPVNDTEFKKTVGQLRIGQKISAIISAVTPFGLFVSLQLPKRKIFVDGLVHISEISWERTEDIAGKFSVGQKVEVVILRIDYEAKRIDLSIKRLTKDPFVEIVDAYPVDKKVKGIVVRAISTGVVVKIEDPSFPESVEGFIRKDKIPPTVSFEVGNVVEATVAQVDARRHRLILVPVLKEKPIGYR